MRARAVRSGASPCPTLEARPVSEPQEVVATSHTTGAEASMDQVPLRIKDRASRQTTNVRW